VIVAHCQFAAERKHDWTTGRFVVGKPSCFTSVSGDFWENGEIAMTSSKELKMFYDLGIQWAVTHHDELLQLLSNRPAFESKARIALDTSGFAESFPIRQYAFYMKNSEQAEKEFIRGAWDKLNNDGTEFELIKSG
jgi:hypothetical protein